MEPYRGTTVESPCHQCERPTTILCACCNRAVCPKHLQASICGRCDEALYIHMKRHDGTAGMQLGVFTGLLTMVAGIVISFPPLMVAGIAGLIVGPFIGIAIYKRRVRTKFFARVRKTGALPEHDPADSNPELRRLKAYVEQVDRPD